MEQPFRRAVFWLALSTNTVEKTARGKKSKKWGLSWVEVGIIVGLVEISG